MVDSTNPRVMANNIKELDARSLTTAEEVEALQIYDDAEVDTGKKWIDDSEIFRKVLHIEELPNATTGSFDIGISSLKDVISLTGYIPQSSNYQGRILPYSNQLVFRYQGDNLLITAASDYSAVGAYIIIEYTKSAPDALNSPAPDDTRSIESEEIREEIPEEIPEENVK